MAQPPLLREGGESACPNRFPNLDSSAFAKEGNPFCLNHLFSTNPIIYSRSEAGGWQTLAANTALERVILQTPRFRSNRCGAGARQGRTLLAFIAAGPHFPARRSEIKPDGIAVVGRHGLALHGKPRAAGQTLSRHFHVLPAFRDTKPQALRGTGTRPASLRYREAPDRVRVRGSSTSGKPMSPTLRGIFRPMRTQRPSGRSMR